jgi:hypothetical protein
LPSFTALTPPCNVDNEAKANGSRFPNAHIKMGRKKNRFDEFSQTFWRHMQKKNPRESFAHAKNFSRVKWSAQRRFFLLFHVNHVMTEIRFSFYVNGMMDVVTFFSAFREVEENRK